jgi:hypothetical protein
MISAVNINVDSWSSLLNELKIQENKPSTHIICTVKKENKLFYQILSKNEWENISKNPKQQSSYSKLRLRDIISLSEKLFSEKGRTPISITISINPFTAILMPLEAWKKSYQCGLLFFHIKELIDSKMKDIFDLTRIIQHTRNPKKDSEEIVNGLKVLEKERKQFHEIFSTLKVMSEKADAHRIQRIRTLWDKCLHWIYTFLFNNDTSKITKILTEIDVKIGNNGILDMGCRMMQGHIILISNDLLNKKGKPKLSIDEYVSMFDQRKAIQAWAIIQGGNEAPFILELANICDEIEKAKEPESTNNIETNSQ